MRNSWHKLSMSVNLVRPIIFFLKIIHRNYLEVNNTFSQMGRGKKIVFVHHAWIHVFPSNGLILFLDFTFRRTQEIMHMELVLLFNFFRFIVLRQIYIFTVFHRVSCC